MSQFPESRRTGSSSPGESSTDLSSAKDAAADAAATGKQAAGEVAQTATTAAKDVAQETRSQARQVAGKTGDQLTEQAGVQKDALVEGLRSLVGQLSEMTQHVEHDGLASEAAAKVRDAASDAADWLDHRNPGEVVDGVRSFGRNRPGVYLAGSLVAGIVAGRLTRGVTAAHSGDHDATPAHRPAADTSANGANSGGRHEHQTSPLPAQQYGPPSSLRPTPGHVQ